MYFKSKYCVRNICLFLKTHECVYYVLSCSLVKRLEFGPAPPRGVSQGAQSPQGGVKILL